jgi:malate dehydrogenase (oxaloacetate-decarboxylating)
VKWTEGRALIGTGSPFEPVAFNGQRVTIAQPNNSYIFPGLALGIIASKARHVTDTMIMAAAKELARLVPTHKDKNANLLPPLSDSRHLSRLIARAVGKRALQDGEAQITDEDMLERELESNIWEPVYVPYVRARMSGKRQG